MNLYRAVDKNDMDKINKILSEMDEDNIDMLFDLEKAILLAKEKQYNAIARVIHAKYLKIRQKLVSKKLPCLNYHSPDIFEMEEYKDIPFFTVIIGEKEYCIGYKMVEFMNMPQNIMANWVQNPFGRNMDAQGGGGMPGDKRYHKLPLENYNIFITHEAFNEIKQTMEDIDTKEFYPAFKLGNEQYIRLGNVQGIFGVSMLHGQLPPEIVYDIEDTFIDLRPTRTEMFMFKMYLNRKPKRSIARKPKRSIAKKSIVKKSRKPKRNTK
jgi:hypothetical protein